MSNDSGAVDFLAGFFVGTLVGAAFALLFAPTAGEETRQQIVDKGIELKQRATELNLDPSRLSELKDREQRTRFMEAVQEGRLAAERRKEELLAQFQSPTVEHSIDLTHTQGTDAS
jgi:gas vesicle protein